MTEAEGALDVARAAAAAGLSWHHLPLPNGNPPGRAREPQIAVALFSMRARLDGGATLLVHCSAGIHRTGMVAAALLGLCGWTADLVPEGLRQLRAVTAVGAGAARLAWAADFASRHASSEARRPPPTSPPCPTS